MAKNEYRGVRTDFLDRETMRTLSVDNELRRRNIVERCNWYMYSSPMIRGDSLRDHYDFFFLCHTAEPDYPPEQEKPNKLLEANPPSEAFLAKYMKPFKERSIQWFLAQDTIPASAIQDVLTVAWTRWQNVSRAKELHLAISKIPNPECIKKVVCLGLGRILEQMPYSGEQENSGDRISPRNIAQHIAAIAIVKQLEKKTGQKIDLYTAEPAYTPQHKIALETFHIRNFVVLDPSYGKHEQFTIIDDSTLIFNMAGSPQCPALHIIQEYARPVAMITSNVSRTGPYQDRLWFEVTEADGNKVQVPGHADLLLSGPKPIGGFFPKRVRDMIVNDYKLEDKFPAEEERSYSRWVKSDLVDYEFRCRHNTQTGDYWFPTTRLYIRKRGFFQGMVDALRF
ncbi:hypothetical protein F4804DRAFT_347326 [Jackrogersella minutella]|nr:hypothetical protein F4804DRAFT_347326 [Jackrogersella minutella]